MGEEAGPAGATTQNLGCNLHTITEAEMNLEFGETAEEPQDVLPSSPPEAQETVSQGEPSTATAGTPNSCLTDMDCPICFSTYDIFRLPKELSCKHSFCAVCLKLLVRNEAGTWMITCPVCRAPTTLFGGLVCTLQNQELLMSRLQNPETKVNSPEASRSREAAMRLDHTSATWISDEEKNARQWTAAKRLVVLLLMLLIVLIVVLQFIYTGIMKWMLGFALGVVVIITVLLCFNPYWKMRSRGATSQPKDDQATATV